MKGSFNCLKTSSLPSLLLNVSLPPCSIIIVKKPFTTQTFGEAFMIQSRALSQREEEPFLISVCDAGVFSVRILLVSGIWLPGWPYQTWSWEEVCAASSCEQVQDVSTPWAFIYVLNLHIWRCIMIFLKSVYINHIKQWVLYMCIM